MNIILASSSPRRRQLLAQAGLDFTVMTAEIDESVVDGETPQAYISRMVAQKAQAALAVLNTANTPRAEGETTAMPKPLLLLTADTIGILPDGQSILIKPTDQAHAFSMWQQMSDNTHQVCTAVQATLLAAESTASSSITASSSAAMSALTAVWQEQIMESTQVTFVPLAIDDMQRYWQSGEPADKAGGYAIQGGAAAWVECINGSYTNVVGLPLAQTLRLIAQAKSALSGLNNERDV